jgi:hypothetical protein
MLRKMGYWIDYEFDKSPNFNTVLQRELEKVREAERAKSLHGTVPSSLGTLGEALLEAQRSLQARKGDDKADPAGEAQANGSAAGANGAHPAPAKRPAQDIPDAGRPRETAYKGIMETASKPRLGSLYQGYLGDPRNSRPQPQRPSPADGGAGEKRRAAAQEGAERPLAARQALDDGGRTTSPQVQQAATAIQKADDRPEAPVATQDPIELFDELFDFPPLARRLRRSRRPAPRRMSRRPSPQRMSRRPPLPRFPLRKQPWSRHSRSGRVPAVRGIIR